MLFALIIVVAYLSGSIPSAVWVGRLVSGVDVRDHGSGNMGATNVARVLGLRWALVVALLDVAKGFAPVFWLGPMASASSFLSLADARLVIGAVAILGHLFPVFARFKGGKGVLTAAGVFLALLPLEVGIGLGVWLLTFLVTRVVSIGSLLAVAAMVGAVLLRRFAFHVPIPDSLVVAALVLAGLVFYTHRANIARLKSGTEPRFRKEQ